MIRGNSKVIGSGAQEDVSELGMGERIGGGGVGRRHA
jgi:hypothetical protein